MAQPLLNDDVLLEIFAHVGILDLANVAKCSMNSQALAIRTFRTKFLGLISLDQEIIDEESDYRQILQEFGAYTNRIEIVGGERVRDRFTDHRNIRLFQCIWLYVNSATVKSLKVHPFYLEADRVNFFGSEVVEVLPQLEELDLLIPLVSANLNCKVPFDVWCPELRILRLSGNFGMDIPADKMPTTLHTIDINYNILIELEQIQTLLHANRFTLRHLILTGLNEIDDLNTFLDFLITIDLHRMLKTLALQLRRHASNVELPHILYTLKPNLSRFQTLKQLDIAGFGNLAANYNNAQIFGTLQHLEVLIISSPLFNLSMEVNEDFLKAFAQNVPANLKEFWLKRLMVKSSVWNKFLALMPPTCKCYRIATG